jgi:hypothetical protein
VALLSLCFSNINVVIVQTSEEDTLLDLVDIFFFLVAPTLGSLLPLWGIGLSFLSFLIRDSR